MKRILFLLSFYLFVVLSMFSQGGFEFVYLPNTIKDHKDGGIERFSAWLSKGSQAGFWTVKWTVTNGYFYNSSEAESLGTSYKTEYSTQSQINVKWTKEGEGIVTVAFYKDDLERASNQWKFKIKPKYEISGPDKLTAQNRGKYRCNPDPGSKAIWKIDETSFTHSYEYNGELWVDAKNINKTGAWIEVSVDGKNYRKTINISGAVVTTYAILGNSSISIGQETIFKLDKDPGAKSIQWNVDPSHFTVIGGLKGKELKVRANNIANTSNSVVEVTVDGVKSYKTVQIEKVNYNVLAMTGCVVCNNNTSSFSVTNLPTGATVQWTGVDKFTLVSGQGTSNATFRASGNGYGKVRADIYYQGNKITSVENSQVWVGEPEQLPNTNYYPNGDIIQPRGMIQVSANMGGEPTSYKWVLDRGRCKFTPFGDMLSIYCLSNYGSFIEFHLDVTNHCGTSTNYYWLRVARPDDDSYFRSASVQDVDLKAQVDIKVYSISGALVYTEKAVANDFDLKTTPLIEGVYIIEKFDGTNKKTEKVLLKR